MNIKEQNRKIIFGLKVKQLRTANGLSFKELSEASSLSVSYLNEIEKGKKFPKQDKIVSLAKTLGVSPEELVSDQLSGSLSAVGELLQSNFLSELPLDLFGIELGKVIEIIANSPTRVGAFISTLVELSRNYALQDENFYFGALRAYQEMHYNYFEEIEYQVDQCIEQFNIPTDGNFTSNFFKTILIKEYKYQIDDGGLSAHPELNKLRSVYIPNRKKLLLQEGLNDRQKTFLFGQELAFNFMEIKERSYTSPIQSKNNFEVVLNNFKSNYFSIALIVNRDRLIEDIRNFSSNSTWKEIAFLKIGRNYNAAPELIFHRLTNIIPKFFNLKQLFFLRMNENDDGHYFLSRVLHLNRQHHPHRSGLNEHYCRRWVSIDILKKLSESDHEYLVAIQRSKYKGSEDEYICMSLAGPAHNNPENNVSVTVGYLVNDALREKLNFTDDPSVPSKIVNTTCERCDIMDCKVRAADARIVNDKLEKQTMQLALKKVFEEVT